MNEQTLSLLNAEIEDEFERLGSLEVGSDEYKVAVEGLTKLVDRQIEMEKFIIEHEDKVNNQEKENDLKRKQMKNENVDRIVKNVFTGVSVVGGIVLTVWGTYKSFEFEKEGSITTIMGRGFINRLLHKS